MGRFRVLVTAGANGSGREIARPLIEEGATVRVCDIDQGALQRLAKSGPEIASTFANVIERSQVQCLFGDAVARLGGLEALINNAGISGPTGPMANKCGGRLPANSGDLVALGAR